VRKSQLLDIRSFFCLSTVPASLLSAAQVLTAGTTLQLGNKLAFEVMSGRSVQIQIAVTWATNQPTSLIWTLKHKKR
jgi:hypothetical protein